MNRIVMNEAKEIVNDCIILGVSFKELDAKVIDKVCDLV